MVQNIIGFNADECSCNGGPVTPEKAMEFARQWVAIRHPAKEAVWVLHKEHCKADGSDRFAVHIAINVTDLETGKRFWEGSAKQAKVARARAMREMDRRWGLRQMVKGERNSLVHSIQPTRAEREMAKRGVKSEKDFIREHVREHVREIRAEAPMGNRMRELSNRLSSDGITMTQSKSGKQLQFHRQGSSFTVNGNRLGRGFSLDGIAKGLGMRSAMVIAREAGQEMER